MKKLSLVATVLILACTTATDTASQPATTPPAAARPTNFKNLQVFPPDIPREQLIEIMKSFTRSLGVRCEFCHVVTKTEPRQEFDFPSDAKEHKVVARTMIRMVQDINGKWLMQLPDEEDRPKPGELKVTCWTCHRGHEEPESPPTPDEAKP
jgi:hypothetical protein